MRHATPSRWPERLLAPSWLTLAAACAPGAPVAELALGGAVSGPVRADTGVAPETSDFHVPPPPFTQGVFPCTDCHDPEIPVNTRRRPLQTAHQEIVLQHDQEHRWCLDCHDAANRDVLHLASGEPVPFEESYRLCGQCHGDKYRDWRAGVHGRRTGSWDGQKEYLLCVACHNAHSPAFKPLQPLAPPKPPRRTP